MLRGPSSGAHGVRLFRPVARFVGPVNRRHAARRDGLALQLQGAFEVRLLRHRLVTSSPDGPGDDERRLDPALR
jgi:hypothetical protein